MTYTRRKTMLVILQPFRSRNPTTIWEYHNWWVYFLDFLNTFQNLNFSFFLFFFNEREREIVFCSSVCVPPSPPPPHPPSLSGTQLNSFTGARLLKGLLITKCACAKLKKPARLRTSTLKSKVWKHCINMFHFCSRAICFTPKVW